MFILLQFIKEITKTKTASYWQRVYLWRYSFWERGPNFITWWSTIADNLTELRITCLLRWGRYLWGKGNRLIRARPYQHHPRRLPHHPRGHLLDPRTEVAWEHCIFQEQDLLKMLQDIQPEVNISPKINISSQTPKMALHETPGTPCPWIVIFLHGPQKRQFFCTWW